MGSSSALIQTKSLTVSRGGTTLQESGLIGNDLTRVFENSKSLALFPMSVAALVGGVTVLWFTIGEGGLVGIACMATVMTLNLLLATKNKAAEARGLAAADVRLGIMKQIINGVKAVKLSCWEEPFLAEICKARRTETVNIGRFRVYQLISVQCGRASPILSAASSFIFLSMTGKPMSAGDIFAALSVFQALRMSLIMIPVSLTIWAAVSVSIGRVQSYLLLDDNETLVKERVASEAEGAVLSMSNVNDVLEQAPTAGAPASDVLIEMRDAGFKWGGSDFTLKGITMQVGKPLTTPLVTRCVFLRVHSTTVQERQHARRHGQSGRGQVLTHQRHSRGDGARVR